MASLDTLLKTMRLEGEAGGGEGVGVTGWERWINLLLVSSLKSSPSSTSSFRVLVCTCVYVEADVHERCQGWCTVEC